MTNRGEGLRLDQSKHANHRTPSRPDEREAWFKKRKQILRYVENGANSFSIAKIMRVSPATVRNWTQRMYNEAEIPPGYRSQAQLLSVAYRKGWLPCPCSRA